MFSGRNGALGRDGDDSDDDESSFDWDLRMPLSQEEFPRLQQPVSTSNSSTVNANSSTSARAESASGKGKGPAETNGAATSSMSRIPQKYTRGVGKGKNNASGKRPSAAGGAVLQRLGSIRGDLNALLNAFDPQLAVQQLQPTVGQLPDNLDVRLCCARSLYKLSCESGGEAAIINGGAIAQIAGMSDIEDARVLRFAAATIANLTTATTPDVLDAFVRLDGITALLELSWSPAIDVKLMCATALSRLSQEAVYAALLVRMRAMNEFSAMLALPHPQLQTLIVSCILNLVHHGTSFPDTVFLGDPHALQNPLGVMSVVTQQAANPSTTAFAVEVMFNMSLHRVCCSCALRGGGAEVLHSLVVQVTKAADALSARDHRSDGHYGAPRSKLPTWMADAKVILRLLCIAAETLANFSAIVDLHAMMSGHTMKTLALLLFVPLRDLNNRGQKPPSHTAADNTNLDMDMSPVARMRHVAVPCSRALANFSSNVDFRRHAFAQDVVHLIARLTLVDARVVPDRASAHAVARNLTRVFANLSFEETCTAYFMEFPHVLHMLHAVVIHSSSGRDTSAAATTFRLWLEDVDDDMKENALITILSLAQQAMYSTVLIRTLDGKKLALAAENPSHSRRLRYIYALVLCNLLFQNHLQQIVAGDQVIKPLVSGLNYIGSSPAQLGPPAPFASLDEVSVLKALNLASDDDQERFLAAIYIVASELMDLSNIEMVVQVATECLDRHVNSSPIAVTPIAASRQHVQPQHREQQQRNHPLTCYASAALHAMARSASQRGDKQSVVFAEDVVAVLIRVCASGHKCGGSITTNQSGLAQAFCAAALYHLCVAGGSTVNLSVLQGLIDCCIENEETPSLLACSASFAIVSFTQDGCRQLLRCQHLALALNRLGRSSHVECQLYAAITACNVSTLECVWSSAELKDLIVVALLRANSVQAKQIHAKTLSNLLSHVELRPKIIEDGVLYALMKLSQVLLTDRQSPASVPSSPPCPVKDPSATTTTVELLRIGLQALFNLSCEPEYHPKLLSNGVMAYLSTVVFAFEAHSYVDDAVTVVASAPSISPAPPATMHGISSSVSMSALLAKQRSSTSMGNTTKPRRSSESPSAPQNVQSTSSGQDDASGAELGVESRRYVLGIVCNLASYETNHEDLMHAQVTDIIRQCVDRDVEILASAAMALRNLSCRMPWVELLCDRRTLELLLTLTRYPNASVNQFAMQALANCSLVSDSLHLFGELRVAQAVLDLLDRVTIDDPEKPDKVGKPDPMASSSTMTTNRVDTYMAALKCLHNVALDDVLARYLLDECVVLRLVPLLEYRGLGASEEACELAATMVRTLAGKPVCAEPLLKQRVVSLCALLNRKHPRSLAIAHECLSALMVLSTCQQIQTSLAETQAIHVIVAICSSQLARLSLRLRELGAVAIRNLTLCAIDQLSLFYGNSAFEAEDEVLVIDDCGEHIDKEFERSGEATSPGRVSSLLHGVGEDCEPRMNLRRSDSTVSRLAERHLFHGVKHLQSEISSGRASDRILLETSAALANLSTVRAFRQLMVRTGVIPTLLEMHGVAAARSAHQRGVVGPFTLMTRVCAATLHRLVVEDGGTVATTSPALVPSLLTVLRITDDELHQVRYECEKVSLFESAVTASTASARRMSLVQGADGGASVREMSPSKSRRRVGTGAGNGGNGGGASSGDGILPPFMVVTTTQCVKQAYREQKWSVYVVKSALSLQSMVPSLEKKPLRPIGLPRLAFQDDEATRLAGAARSIAPSTAPAPAPVSGYLLGVNRDKFHILRDTNGREFVATSAGRGGCRDTTALTASASGIEVVTSRDSAHVDAVIQQHKFDRHMRTSRRNYRRHQGSISSLPPVQS